MIYCYKKHITREISRWMVLPEGATELATIDGITYVFVPDATALPEQPAEIAASISTVVMDKSLLAEIKAASPHVRLINERVAASIAARYSIGDEIKMLRVGGAEREAYEAYVEECRACGREQKAAIGLGGAS